MYNVPAKIFDSVLKGFCKLAAKIFSKANSTNTGGQFMIKLTRFNSDAKKRGEFILNAELIQTIETTPDTVITLVNEKKLIVEEPADEVVRRVMKYRRALRQF